VYRLAHRARHADHCRFLLTTALLLAILWSPSGGAAAERPGFEAYGFIRLDMLAYDSHMNNNLVPMWVKNEHDGSVQADDDAFIISPRLTRVGIRFNGYALSDNWKGDVGIEIDFQGFAEGSESRETPRMRLGYFRLHYQSLEILGGQHWDLISPLYPNVNLNGVHWNVGNTGDRRPQFRLTLSPKSGETAFSLAAAVGAFGAINMNDVDKDGVPDGHDAAFPMFQGRVGIIQPVGDAKFDLGFWGHYGRERANVVPGVNAASIYESWSAGSDLTITVNKQVAIFGEAWVGDNLSDIRGGVAQGIDAPEGATIAAIGGWGELDYTPTDRWTLLGGYSVDDPEDSDLIRTGQRTKNHSIYGAVRHRPWGKPFQITVEYMHWMTDYTGFADASVCNNVVLHMMYSF